MSFFRNQARNMIKGQPAHYLAPRDETELVKASRRVAKLSGTSLLEWLDVTITEMGRLSSQFRSRGDIEDITELKQNMIAYQAVVLELYLRSVESREKIGE